MSMYCGACREEVAGGYGALYLLYKRDKETNQLKLPKDNDLTIPQIPMANIYMCGKCFELASEEERLNPKDALNSKITFAFVWDIGPENHSGYSCLMMGKNFTFFSNATVKKYWPKARPIIGNMAFRSVCKEKGQKIYKEGGHSCSQCKEEKNIHWHDYTYRRKHGLIHQHCLWDYEWALKKS